MTFELGTVGGYDEHEFQAKYLRRQFNTVDTLIDKSHLYT